MASEQAIHDARAAAEFQSTALWGRGGFIFAIIAVIIAVARKPSLDTTALERHDDEDTETSSAPSTSPSSSGGRSPRSSRARLSSGWSYSCW